MKTDTQYIFHIGNLNISDRPWFVPYSSSKGIIEALLFDLKGIMKQIPKENKFLVVSGGIVASGRIEEFKRAGNIVKELISSAEIYKENVIIVPGTHDILFPLARKNKLKNFKNFMKEILGAKKPIWPEISVFEENKLVFISFDSTRKTYLVKPSGFIYQKDIFAIQKKLNFYQNRYDLNEYLKIVVMHHGIEKHLSGPLCIDNNKQFIDFLLKQNVNIVMTSAAQLPGYSKIENSTNKKLISVGTGSLAEETWRSGFRTRHYQIIKIEGKDSIGLLNRVYIPDRYGWGFQEELKDDLIKNDEKDFIQKSLKSVPIKKSTKKQKNEILEHLSRMSHQAIQILLSNLKPAISNFNSDVETKDEFVKRIVKYFESENSLDIIKDEIKSVSGIDEYETVKIYISSSNEDKDIKLELIKKLSKFGFNIAHIKWDVNRRDRIENKIAEELKSSNIMLVLLSKNSVNSKYLKYEISLWLSSRGTLKIIPILIDDCEIPELLKDLKIQGIKDENFFDNIKTEIQNKLTDIKQM